MCVPWFSAAQGRGARWRLLWGLRPGAVSFLDEEEQSRLLFYTVIRKKRDVLRGVWGGADLRPQGISRQGWQGMGAF